VEARNFDVIALKISDLEFNQSPKLLDSLSDPNKDRIAKTAYLRCYEKDEVIFHQNDVPDAYYTVIRGAVSIYVHEENTHPRSGKFLMQLPPGASFGELSFNLDNKHSRRNAGVVSDGAHGQSKVLANAHIQTSEAHNGELDASDIAVLLLIPEKIYMEELYPGHSSKHLTKEKIAYLKSSILFSGWSMDDLVKTAYSMKKKTYEKGTIIATQGEYFENIVMLKSGVLSVYLRVPRNGSSSKSSHCYEDDIKIDIAELKERDVFGLVEVKEKCKKNMREALAITSVEAFVIQASTFHGLLRYQPKTFKLIDRVAQKRMNWEKLRKEFAMKFSSSMPLTLPKNVVEISNYRLSDLSILSEREIRIREEKKKALNRSMRKIRLLQREESSRAQLQSICEEAIKISTELNDKVKRQYALSIINSLSQDC
jgi:CRP-like cAMP-binding protein